MKSACRSVYKAVHNVPFNDSFLSLTCATLRVKNCLNYHDKFSILDIFYLMREYASLCFIKYRQKIKDIAKQ